MLSVLLLNNDYSPLQVISWRRAIELLYREVAERVEVYSGQVIRTATSAVPFPAVVRLTTRFARRKIRRNRRNLLARDAYTCQYCGLRPRQRNGDPRLESLTIDHVVPQSRAVEGFVRLPWAQGKRVRVGAWENLLTACQRCNAFKGARTPEECGLRMRRVPRPPSSFDLAWMSIFRYDIRDEWKDYLPDGSPWRDYWEAELEA